MLVVRSGTVLPSETGRQCHGNMSMNKRTNTFKTSVKSHECCPLCSAIKASVAFIVSINYACRQSRRNEWTAGGEPALSCLC